MQKCMCTQILEVSPPKWVTSQADPSLFGNKCPKKTSNLLKKCKILEEKVNSLNWMIIPWFMEFKRGHRSLIEASKCIEYSHKACRKFNNFSKEMSHYDWSIFIHNFENQNWAKSETSKNSERLKPTFLFTISQLWN